jgi:hypothetical protein
VPTPEGEATLALYAISGIDFSPVFAWFDDSMTLAALDFGRMGMLPQGWDPAMLETLATIQGEQNPQRAERPSAELAHRTDRPVLFENFGVIDVVSGELLAVRRNLYTPSFEIGEERIEDWANTAVRQAEMIRKLYEVHIQLVAGTDDMPGFTLHRELELCTQAGIPNAAVLKIATLDSARIIGVAEETGSIEAGKIGELLLLDGNPLQDISAVRGGVLVMKGDTLYRPDELYRAVGVEPFLDSRP